MIYMARITLGRTGITVDSCGFGALPVQRCSHDDGVRLLRCAYENGIDYFDTARAYSDSEEKIGDALSDVRSRIVIATKTGARDAESFRRDLDISLKMLKTDYIDIYQFHNPPFCPKPGDGSGLYEAMLDAKAQGMIRHISITNHKITLAYEAIESGLYDTLQFPLSYLADEKECALADRCRELNVGFICMKALAGGLITRTDAAWAYISQFENALPIWGIQRERELDEFIAHRKNPPFMTDEIAEFIEKERKSLSGEFCRGCGYCMPCPENIEINNAARMSLMLRRAPTAGWLSEAWQAKMKLIENCRNCGLCASKCPYGLDTPALLKRNYEDYKTFLK